MRRYARLAENGVQLVAERAVSYVFSDDSVARDGCTIATAGWQLDNFKANPVFLWAHDTGTPPIGKVTKIGTSGSRLVGTVEYATREQNPFADTIYELVRGGFLSAVSVSWQPLTWAYTNDKTRPGGIDFKTQELWEVSQVPVPALPSALATARARGIDTGPIFKWAERMLDIRASLPGIRPGQLEAVRAASRGVPGADAQRLANALRRRERLADIDKEIAALTVHPDIARYRAVRNYPISGAADEARHREIRERAAAAYAQKYGRGF